MLAKEKSYYREEERHKDSKFFVKSVEFSSVLGSVLKTSIRNPATDA